MCHPSKHSGKSCRCQPTAPWATDSLQTACHQQWEIMSSAGMIQSGWADGLSQHSSASRLISQICSESGCNSWISPDFLTFPERGFTADQNYNPMNLSVRFYCEKAPLTDLTNSVNTFNKCCATTDTCQWERLHLYTLLFTWNTFRLFRWYFHSWTEFELHNKDKEGGCMRFKKSKANKTWRLGKEIKNMAFKSK